MSIPLHDPAWLERMYNNRALVPDYMDYPAALDPGLHAGARQLLPCALDLAYGPEAGETLDVFPATRPGATLAPVLVFIHGGYWRSLDKSDHSFGSASFHRGGVLRGGRQLCAVPRDPEHPVTVPHWPPNGGRTGLGVAPSGSMVETAARITVMGIPLVGNWPPGC